jgi:hypothetical protein
MLGTLIMAIFSSFGYNEVEGVRLRAGGRTYFGTDTWRLRGIRRMVLKTINLNTDFQESGWLIGK